MNGNDEEYFVATRKHKHTSAHRCKNICNVQGMNEITGVLDATATNSHAVMPRRGHKH